jgi:DNA invertase Pin-like site-specific DNA recombinase
MRVQKITIFLYTLFYVEISGDYIYFFVQKPNKIYMFTKVLVFKLWYTNDGYRRFVFFLKIGYARVSTVLQNLNLQEDQLNQYGCEKIFSANISGSKSKRPVLVKAIEFARAGDTIVVWRLDRLGRNMEDKITLVNELNNRGVSFHSLEENITMDKSSSTGQLLFTFIRAAFAEFERTLILERSSAGFEIAARARGRYEGRPEKLNNKDLKLLKTLYDNGFRITYQEQWQSFTYNNFYRYLNKIEDRKNEMK